MLGRETQSDMSRLVARFAFYYSYPHRIRCVLNQSDINVIKEIAETERSASDRRGTYLSVRVIGVIGFLWTASSSSASWFLKDFPDGFRVQSLFNIESNLTNIVIMLGWTSVCIIGNLLGLRLINYLHDFLISEYSNGTIIHTCIETTELFRSQDIKNIGTLNFEQKESIAGVLGYEILSANESASVSSKNIFGHFIQDEDQ